MYNIDLGCPNVKLASKTRPQVLVHRAFVDIYEKQRVGRDFVFV